MDRASLALVDTRYFECERLSLRAMGLARGRRDYARMARICLPLLEARRQKRQLAIDEGRVAYVSTRAVLRRAVLRPGVYLVRPPLVGVDGRALRRLADRLRTPAVVLTCEPPTPAGSWPVVAVGAVSVRPRETRAMTVRTHVPSPGADPPGPDWIMLASEMLGDEAIGRVRPEDPAGHRVDDLLEFLEAHPDHEKLHQRLEEACRAAEFEPPAARTRLRPVVRDPWCF